MSIIEQKMAELTSNCPETLKPVFMSTWTRIVWQAGQVVKHVPSGGKILDIGGGAVPFMALCQELGYETTMVDDYKDDFYNDLEISEMLNQFRSIGVNVLEADFFAEGFTDQFEGLDMVTSQSSLEHWHNSPKKLLHEFWGKLNTNGLLWLGFPNCVNMRKRITVPFGYGKWSQMEEWYELSIFRGHVREPDVDDLRYIAKDLGARKVQIEGRNWLGYTNPNTMIRAVTPLVDKVLQFRPSLCSDIYLYAWK